MADAGVPASTPDAAEIVKPRQTVMMVIASKPEGADIWKDDEHIGDAPSPIEVEVGETVHLVLKKKGYEDKEVDVTGSREQKRVTVPLKKIKKPHGTGSGSGSDDGTVDDSGDLE